MTGGEQKSRIFLDRKKSKKSSSYSLVSGGTPYRFLPPEIPDGQRGAQIERLQP
ncbi:hypothetical protein CupriaWKF_24470 [Cupriavidus sp. WKF15]|uniref:hypothetical protein n=1 Tax=Cupriavidus sp. WKF15 TaxID=3032282 RepID=UPI0023E309A8|nr:hypothetical protein [Cupriavidus sp. WKF15]WER47972.1 hypothetical protein CupriaWKF_24470 [Cupriavidus sp. WKF15]